MRIVFAVLYYDDSIAARGAVRYLEAMPLHRELGAALARAGHEVEVVFLFPVDAHVEDDLLSFRFVAPGRLGRLAGTLATKVGRERGYYEPALRAIDAITRTGADVVHFHGTTLHMNLALLAVRIDGPRLVVQHHGGGLPKNAITRALQKRGFARADRVLFTSRAHARPFVAAGSLDDSKVTTAVEISTPLKPLPRDESRQKSGLIGDPVFVSLGRLHPDKDPFTTLKGFELIARQWRGARLYLYYLTDELLPTLKRYVDQSPTLADRVQFLGRVSHDAIPRILSSADFLLQASRREVAGYAVVEAMAAGVIPVVTRIDAFQAITDGGRQGLLFAVGNPEDLARTVLGLDVAGIPLRRASVRAHFEAHLNFTALARRLEDIYAQVLGGRRRTA
jgi:glycosyltransferase involved in cell wall biosynthesis